MESTAKAGVAMAAGMAATAAFLKSKPDSANLWATMDCMKWQKKR